MNVLISQPQFLIWFAESVFVIIPIPIEIFPRVTIIISSLNDCPTSTVSDHVAVNLQVPELGSCNLQVVDARLIQALVVQIGTRVTLKKE